MLTPSHNPPEDGGYKYNPPSGGPADTSITKAIEEEANRLIEGGLADVLRAPDPEAQVVPHDYVAAYVDDLPNVIDIDAIRDAGVHIGADPLGGASVAYFSAIARAAAASTSTWSTRRSTRRSRSCRSTTTARSGWTARRRTRWPG